MRGKAGRRRGAQEDTALHVLPPYGTLPMKFLCLASFDPEKFAGSALIRQHGR